MKYFNQYFLILICVCQSLFCEESEHPAQTACLQLFAIPKKPFVSIYINSYYNASVIIKLHYAHYAPLLFT